MSQLDELLEVAVLLSSHRGGMASVSVKYNPYEALWVAKADWSDSSKIEASGQNSKQACNALLELLDAELEGVRGSLENE